MRSHIILCLLGCLMHTREIFSDTTLPRIAIVGGGIGGASTSHFLTELLNGNLKIDLYEAKTIGGRLATVKIGNDEIEAGGSIIHSKNMYMQKFVKFLGLEHKPSTGKDKMSIWNGNEFVFKESDWSLITYGELFLRYGFQLLTLNRHISDILDDFTKIYDLQDAGISFANVTALLSALNEDFPKLLQTSINDHLLDMNFTKQLIDELVKAAIVVNYNQDTNIQSFVSLVSLAGVSGDLWAVKNGNKQVPQSLIYRNKNVNVVPSRVTKVRYVADNDKKQYEVTYLNKDSAYPMTFNYDAVIIATPLTHDQAFPIKFVGFPNDFVFSGNYQTTYATFVKGNLNSTYFGLQETLDTIMSCDVDKTIINAVAQQIPVDGIVKEGSKVWKIFSRKSVNTDVMQKMFSKITETKEILWKAYPQYPTDSQLNKFKLHDALYHVNAIEWAASAMEMSAIAGRNVAILASNDLLQKSKSTSAEAKEYSEYIVFAHEILSALFTVAF